jgi:hypothetical protein
MLAGGGKRPNKALAKFAQEAKIIAERPSSGVDGDVDVGGPPDDADASADASEDDREQQHAAPVRLPFMGSPSPGGMGFMSEINAKLGIKKVATLPAVSFVSSFLLFHHHALMRMRARTRFCLRASLSLVLSRSHFSRFLLFGCIVFLFSCSCVLVGM